MRKKIVSLRHAKVLKMVVALAFAINFLNFFFLYFNAPYTRNSLFANNMVSMAMQTGITIIVKYIAMAAFAFAALIAAKEKRTPVKLPMIVLMLSGLIWTVVTYLQVGLRGTLIANPTPMIFIMSVCIFIGYHDRIWPYVLKCVRYTSIAYTALAAYETVRFVGTYGLTVRLMTSGAIYALVASVMLLYVNILMNEDTFKKYKAVTMIQLVVLLLCTLVLQSRSWLVHVIFLICILVYKTAKEFKYSKLMLTLIIIAICIVTILSWSYLTVLSSSLMSRMNTDSRSEQLITFFEQVSFMDLLIGGGLNATYQCFGTNYGFIDNLYLLTMFKYGAVPLVSYLALLLPPVFYGLFHRKSPAARGTIFLLSWLAVMMGVSIFVAYSDNIYNYVIYMVIGRMTYLKEKETGKRRGAILRLSRI